MVKRRVLGLLGLMAAGVFVFSATLRSADEPAKAGPHAHNPHMEHCSKACADCMRACESCARHCAEMVADGHKDHMMTLATCADCGDICGTASKVTARSGPLAVPICEGCAKVCDACGSACEKFPDDKHMKACADACRDCAKACRDMLEHAGH